MYVSTSHSNEIMMGNNVCEITKMHLYIVNRTASYSVMLCIMIHQLLQSNFHRNLWLWKLQQSWFTHTTSPFPTRWADAQWCLTEYSLNNRSAYTAPPVAGILKKHFRIYVQKLLLLILNIYDYKQNVLVQSCRTESSPFWYMSIKNTPIHTFLAQDFFINLHYI